MKRIIQTEKAGAMYNPVSQAAVAGGMLYTAGMIGRDPVTGEMRRGFEAQAQQALENLGAILQAAGAGYRDVVFMQLHLLDMANVDRCGTAAAMFTAMATVPA